MGRLPGLPVRQAGLLLAGLGLVYAYAMARGLASSPACCAQPALCLAYRVGDRYVFYLPSYLPAVWLAAGTTVGSSGSRQGQP